MKIGFVSLGCPKNLVDSEVMMGQLAADGHTLTPQPEEADVIVINTCSFIDPAKQESVDTILEMAEYKKTGKAQRLVVAGCLVERYREDIRKNLPEVDAVLGTNELSQITALCEGLTPHEQVPEPYLYHDLTARVFTTPRHSAYIKIAEGCDHPCTFCVIPQFRGQFRSRRPESVINEAKRMFATGVREINLIGQDTTCFGEDLGLKDGLADLLGRLATIPTDLPKWIRVLYVYPNKVNQKLLDTLAAHEALVKYIDMPLQHASAATLKRMKRGAHGDIFLKLLGRIRATIPGVAIRTSMIVGFPGETDAEFSELCQFVEAAQFDRLGVFSYSDEETSGSYRLADKVDPKTIYHRKRSLMALQRRISLRKNKQLIGRDLPVLIEGPSRETELLWEARLGTQAPEIDGVCYINDFGSEETVPRPGEMRLLRVTEAHDYDLVGALVDNAESGYAQQMAGEGTVTPFPILQANTPRSSAIPVR